MGHDIIQLHPLDVGVLLELDAFLPRDAWFWDDLPPREPRTPPGPSRPTTSSRSRWPSIRGRPA